jgi:hypothetical protein
VKDIVAAESVISGEDIGRSVSLDMADMEAVTAGVGEHVEDEEFFRFGSELGVTGICGSEYVGIHPVLLPAGLKFRERIVLAGKRHLVRTVTEYGI